jgi:hypothetical protein
VGPWPVIIVILVHAISVIVEAAEILGGKGATF